MPRILGMKLPPTSWLLFVSVLLIGVFLSPSAFSIVVLSIPNLIDADADEGKAKRRLETQSKKCEEELQNIRVQSQVLLQIIYQQKELLEKKFTSINTTALHTTNSACEDCAHQRQAEVRTDLQRQVACQNSISVDKLCHKEARGEISEESISTTYVNNFELNNNKPEKNGLHEQAVLCTMTHPDTEGKNEDLEDSSTFQSQAIDILKSIILQLQSKNIRLEAHVELLEAGVLIAGVHNIDHIKPEKNDFQEQDGSVTYAIDDMQYKNDDVEGNTIDVLNAIIVELQCKNDRLQARAELLKADTNDVQLYNTGTWHS